MSVRQLIHAAASASGPTVSDGSKWKQITAPANTGPVCFGNGRFVALGASTSTLYSTDNGDNWTIGGTTSAAAAHDIVYGGGLFVGIRHGGTTTTAFRSSDGGVSWTSGGVQGSIASTCGIAYGAGLFVVTLSGGGIYTSADAVTWTKRASYQTNKPYWDGTQFLACGSGSSVSLSTSTTGTSWSQNATAFNTARSRLAFGLGTYFATGNTSAGESATSITSWTARTMNASTVTWNDLAVGDVSFVAVGAAGTGGASGADRSSDGTTWVVTTMPTAGATYSSVAYGNGVFVATAGTANIAVSIP